MDEQTRKDIWFSSNGTDCAAWLYASKEGKLPVIVMAHGLGSTRDMRIDAFAAAFSEAGFACFLFDYRNNGDSKGDRRYRINVKEQLEDWNNAVKFVSTLEQVDPNRIYLFGTSFSGGHVMTLAANNAAVKGVVAQCPYTDTFASVFAVPFVTRTKLLFTLFADCFTRLFGHRIFVPLAGKPGSTALMVSQDYEVYLNLIGKDEVAPAKKTLQYIKRTPNAVVKVYDCGHFDIYFGKYYDEAIADYIAFFKAVDSTICE